MILNRKYVIDLISEITGQQNAFEILENALINITKSVLSESLLECGIIPECFELDSSEEKMWAKYCDILLAHTWTYLSIPSEVLRTRGDSADVFGKTNTYSIVGDAKAFRLSRTAKNQKDFKVQALDDWRKSNTYAILVAPLYQYPKRTSQIYQQAIDRNITLLSYIHLKFLLDHFTGQDLTRLWNIASGLPKSNNAKLYWEAIDRMVCQIFRETDSKLKDYKLQVIETTKELGQEGIDFWKAKIESYKKLSQEEAILRLIKAEKIKAKIQTIRKAINITIPE
ncbi:HindIII family type II restriction endonuclease [Candidatus Poribacteria bacterium]|nr:HindIII family type II restriction endonuclease [Candidatus Poribacteria bacterium]